MRFFSSELDSNKDNNVIKTAESGDACRDGGGDDEGAGAGDGHGSSSLRR